MPGFDSTYDNVESVSSYLKYITWVQRRNKLVPKFVIMIYKSFIYEEIIYKMAKIASYVTKISTLEKT